MDEALFFSLQLENFPGHEDTMRQFAEANGIPFDLALIYQLIEDRQRERNEQCDTRHIEPCDAHLRTQENGLHDSVEDSALSANDHIARWYQAIIAKRFHSPDAHQCGMSHHSKHDSTKPSLHDATLMSAIIARRRHLGLTQLEFARRLGVSVRTYQDWEQGRRKPSAIAKRILGNNC